MGASAHFFSEDVGRINLPGDMLNINSSLLTVTKPNQKAGVLENNTSIHAAKLKKREKSAICDRAAQLGTPAGITVRRKLIGRA